MTDTMYCNDPMCSHGGQPPPSCRSQMLSIEQATPSAQCTFRLHAPIFDSPVNDTLNASQLRCAVVSSAGGLFTSRCGCCIDKHDLVMRMNWAPVAGFERDVGSKTTFQMMNSHNSRMLRGRTQEAHACAASEALLFFGDEWVPGDNETALAAKFNAMRGCVAPPPFRKAMKLAAHVGLWKGAVPRLFNAWLRSLNRRRGSLIPTAGFYAVHTALALCHSVTLFGFNDDGEALPPGSPPPRFHYYNNQTTAQAKNTIHFHDMALEHAYYARLANATLCPECCTDAGLHQEFAAIRGLTWKQQCDQFLRASSKKNEVGAQALASRA